MRKKLIIILFIFSAFSFFYGCDKTINQAEIIPNAPRNLSARTIPYGTKLNWNPPSNANTQNMNIIRYNVYRSVNGTDFYKIAEVIYNITTFTDTTGELYQNYIYIVSASTQEVEGIWSATCSHIFNSVFGIWTLNMAFTENYPNPPTTQLFIDREGNFSIMLNLFIGFYNGTNNFDTREIRGKISENNQITNGFILGGSQVGQFTGQVDVESNNGNGYFTNFLTIGTTNLFAPGTWNLTR
jgi:hypothetical protein